MGVESATFISQLNALNPTASDNISEGDDHIRMIKTVLKTQFPNLTAAAVNATVAQMNKLGFEPGTVCMFAASVPTTQTISGVNDWLECNGSAYSTSTYSALYGVIGTTFGQDGSDFKVPDYRDYLPVGAGSTYSVGTATSNLAATGSDVVKFQPIRFMIKT